MSELGLLRTEIPHYDIAKYGILVFVFIKYQVVIHLSSFQCEGGSTNGLIMWNVWMRFKLWNTCLEIWYVKFIYADEHYYTLLFKWNVTQIVRFVSILDCMKRVGSSQMTTFISHRQIIVVLGQHSWHHSAHIKIMIKSMKFATEFTRFIH